MTDLATSVAFYRLPGLAVEEAAHPDWARHHATLSMPGGMRPELDSSEFTRQWNPDFKGRPGQSGCVFFFAPAASDDVDRLSQIVSAAGYASQKSPEGAFWATRYAIVENPNGNAVGSMSAIDPARLRRPPPLRRG